MTTTSRRRRYTRGALEDLRAPLATITERRRGDDGTLLVRFRCPVCTRRHWVPLAAVVVCRRTGYPVRLPRSDP